jgi:hypothetical protein
MHVYGFDSAANQHQLVPGEETLTDSVMLGLMRRRFPYIHFRGRLPTASHIKVHQFTTHTEGKTGADWNLLFKLPTGRLNFRIQAKRLYRAGGYSKLNNPQLHTLLAVSKKQGAIPMYAFYNGPSSNASIRANCRVSGDERRGCTVVNAHTVHAGTHAWTRNGIGSTAIPLECLASCFCFDPGQGGGPPPTPGDDDRYNLDLEFAARKIDSKPPSVERIMTVVSAAAVQAGTELDPPLDALNATWSPELEPAVEAWIAGDTTLLNELERTYFANTSHVVLINGDM